MPFFPPNFNLTCNIWNDPNAPPSTPSLGNVPCQLYFPKQDMIDLTPGTTALWRAPIFVRLPKLTDVRMDPAGTAAVSQLECPAGSGRFYAVTQVDDAHKGFANEYRVAICQPVGPWPFPIP